MMKKLRYKYYNKRITTRDNGNVQSYDWEESKLNNIIIENSSAPQLQMTIKKAHSMRITKQLLKPIKF